MDIHYGDGVNLLQIKQKVVCKIEHAQFDISHTISFAHCGVDLCDFGGTIQGPRLGVAPPFTKGFSQSLATIKAINTLDYPKSAYNKYGIRSFTPGDMYGWLRDNVVGVFLKTNGTPGQYIDGVVHVPPQPEKIKDFDIIPNTQKLYGYPQVNDVYELRFKIWPTSGYFQIAFATAPGSPNAANKLDMDGNTLTYSAYKTDPISFDASAQDILDALTPGLTSDFTVDVTGGPLPEYPIYIELTGTYMYGTFNGTLLDGSVIYGAYPDGSSGYINTSIVRTPRQGLSGLMCVLPLDTAYLEDPSLSDDDPANPETSNDGDDYTRVKPLPIIQLVQMFSPKIAASGLTYYRGTYDHLIVNGTSYSAVTWIKQWQLAKYLTQIFDHFDVRVFSNIFDWLVELNTVHDWGYDMTSFLVQGDLTTEVVHYENQDSQTYVASGEPWNVFYYLRAIRNFLETVSQDKFGVSYEYCPLWARYNKNNFLLANIAMNQAGFTWSYDYAMIYALAGDWTWTTPNIEDLGNYGKYSVDDVTSVLPNAIIQPAAPAPNSQQLVGNLLQYLGTTTWRALKYTYVVSTATAGANTVPPWFDLDQVLPQMNAVSYNGFSHNLTYPFYTVVRTKIVQATKHAFQKQWSTPGDVVWFMNAGTFKGLPVGTMVTLACYKWDGVVLPPGQFDYSHHISLKISSAYEATSIGAGSISSMIAEICDFPQSCTQVTCGTDPNGLDDIYVFPSPPYNPMPPNFNAAYNNFYGYGLSQQSSPWGPYPNENRFYVLGIVPARQDVSNLTWAEVKDLPDTGNNSVIPNWQNDAGRITNPDPWTALKYSSYTYTSNYLSPYPNGANIYQGASYSLAAGFGCNWVDPNWDGNNWYVSDGLGGVYPIWSADYQGEHGGCYLGSGSLTINYSESTTAYLIDTGGLTIRQFLGAQFKDYLIERLTHVGTKTNNYSATSGAMYNGPPAIFNSQNSYSATLFYPMRGTNGNPYGWLSQGLIDTTNLQNQYATVQPSKYKAHCTVKCGFISGSLRSVVGTYTQQATYPTYHYDPISQTYVYGYAYSNSYGGGVRPADETMMDAIVSDTGATILDLRFTESTFKQPSDPDNQWYATRNNSALNTQGVNGFQQFGYSYQVWTGFGYNTISYGATFPRKMTYDEREVNVAASQISDLDPGGKNLFYISFEYKIDDIELDSVSALAAKMKQTIFCNGEVMLTDCTLNNTLVSPVNLTSSMGKGVTGNSSATLMGYNKNDVYGVVNGSFPQDVSDVPKLLVGPLRLELENDIYTVEGQATF